MPKRRAGSPDPDRARKRLSLTALAAKASSGSLRYEPDGSFLNIFMPNGRLKRNNSINLRSASKPFPRSPPLRPGLELSGRPLQSHAAHDIASIKELLIFPTSTAMIKPNWIFRYNVNCTPQLGSPLPEHIERSLYDKYVSTRLYPRPDRLPYIHLGHTALGFRLNFYLILPCASTASGPSGTGSLSYRDLQLVYDDVIRPALDVAYPKPQGWSSWIAAKNESHLKPLKSRRKSSRTEPQEERLHCNGLKLFWQAVQECSDNHHVAQIMRNYALVAYGDVAVHDWSTDWRPSWAQFTQLWNDGVDAEYVGPDTRFTMEMSLTFEDEAHKENHGRIGVPTFPTPLPRSCTPVSNLHSPPMSAPPRVALPPIPANVVIPTRREGRRVSSRHSMRIVDEEELDQLADLKTMD